MRGAGRGYLLRVEGASLTYPGSRQALRNAGFSVQAGELVALVGPNGGGKTSLLRLIAGLAPGFYDAQTTGTIYLEGDPLAPGDPRLRENASLLQPDPQLQVVGVTPLHEALLAPIIQGVEAKEALRLASWALRQVGLEGLEREPTSFLSTGQLQRAGLAGLLTSRPRLLLLDEPTSHLDPGFRARVPGLLRKLASEEGIGIVTAGQDPLLARSADRVFCVEVGVWECTEGWEEWLGEKTTMEGEGVFEADGHLDTPVTPPPEKTVGDTAVSLRGVEARYPGGRRVLEDVSLEARLGELVALVGPNGGGKTSLLRLIAGLLKPFKGKVEVTYRPAYLPSEPLLVFSRGTLRDELEGRPSPLPLPPGVVETPVTWLSRGQLQLAALSLLLSRAPTPLLLLDEPTFALDPLWAARVRRLVKSLASQGYAIVAATHDEELARVADRVYMVEGGRVWEA